VKTISYLHPSVIVKNTKGRGRGVFSTAPIAEGETIEVSPVIVMSFAERKLLDQTLLHDYIFEWGEKKDQCAMALGYIPLYNHSYNSNCEYEMDFKKKTITVKTVKDIRQGEELFINYNGDAGNEKPVWFDAR
jgi:uncharacterized protein